MFRYGTMPRKSCSLSSGVGDGIAYVPCHLAGCRAPELADGAVRKQIDAISERHLAQLMKFTEDLKDQDVGTILSDFNTEKSHGIALLEAKLQFW